MITAQKAPIAAGQKAALLVDKRKV